MLKLLFFAFVAFFISCLVAGCSRLAKDGRKEERVEIGSVFKAIVGLGLLAFALYVGVKILFLAISY